MKLKLFRYNLDDNFTKGVLFLDDAFECFTLEDASRPQKIAGETCIPPGTYRLQLRTESTPMNDRYAAKFDDHEGMIWLQHVPDFTFVYLHIGNFPKDTEGCILLGKLDNGTNSSIGSSTQAYRDLYPVITDALLAGEECSIKVIGGGSR